MTSGTKHSVEMGAAPWPPLSLPCTRDMGVRHSRLRVIYSSDTPSTIMFVFLRANMYTGLPTVRHCSSKNSGYGPAPRGAMQAYY